MISKSVPRENSPHATLAQLGRSVIIILCLIYCAVGGLFSFANPAGNSALGSSGVLGAAEEDSTVSTFLHRLVCLLLVYLLVPHIGGILRILSKLKVIALLTILPLLSLAWSDNRLMTLKDGIYLLFTMFFAVYLAECVPPEKQMRAFLFTGSLVGLLCVLFAVLIPRFGIDNGTGRGGEWQGIFFGKNNCAAGMFFLLIPSILLTGKGSLFKLAKYSSVLMMLFVIGMTRSRTTWLITASFLVFLAALKVLGRFKKRDLLALAPLVAGVAAVAVIALYLNLRVIVQLLGRDMTFSGRTRIWAAIMISIAKHPLVGYGYRAFWQGMAGESANVITATGWFFGYAHNGFLEVWLQLGLIGLFLWALTFLKGLKDAVVCFYPGRPAYIDVYICVIIYTVFYNITEASIMTRFNLIWVMYVLSCVALHYAALERRKMLQRELQIQNRVFEHAVA